MKVLFLLLQNLLLFAIWKLRKPLRLLLIAVPLLLILTPPLLFFLTRHRPWDIPPSDRPPVLMERPVPGISIRYLGVSCFEIKAGGKTIITDPDISRFSLPRIMMAPLKPDTALAEKTFSRPDIILINHAHYDHILDAPELMRNSRAKLLGPGNAVNLMLSEGIAADRLTRAEDGGEYVFGEVRIRAFRTRHTPILGIEEPMHGVQRPELSSAPKWFWQYCLDDTFFYLIRTPQGSILFHPATAHARGELKGNRADLLILGMSGVIPADYADLAREAGARIVIPAHFDNFLQPFEKGLALMPGLNYEKLRDRVKEKNRNAAWYALDYGQKIFINR